MNTIDAITRFLQLQTIEVRLAPRTLELYSSALARFQHALENDTLTLEQVQPHHIRLWIARLHASGLAPRTIALHLSAWRSFYKWLCRQGLLHSNPVNGIRAPKQTQALPKALAVDQAVALSAYDRTTQDTQLSLQAQAIEIRDQAITELLYSCGLRSAELISLDYQVSAQSLSWLDLSAAEAHVLGKGQKRRSVPIGLPAIQAIQRWLQTRSLLADANETALFVGQQGRRLSAPQLRNRLKLRAQQAGLPTHVHPHMLRHSFASHLLQSSGDLRAVQELLGHAHISTTQIYTQLDFQHLAQVYDQAHPRAKSKSKAKPEA